MIPRQHLPSRADRRVRLHDRFTENLMLLLVFSAIFFKTETTTTAWNTNMKKNQAPFLKNFLILIPFPTLCFILAIERP